jgi:hypothetical protein
LQTHQDVNSAGPETDVQELRRLNDEYVRAFLESDVEWYETHLTDDFNCTLSDGTIIGKREFLEETAEGPGTTEFGIDNVNIRVYGDAALVQARTKHVAEDGSRGQGVYTDIYIRRDSAWQAVAAHLTAVK